MKKFLLTVSCFLLAFCFCSGQEKTAEEYLQRYNLLLGKLGATGVGIETLLNNWERDYPEDKDMLSAKFNFYFNKSQRSEIVPKDKKKFLGNSPALTLTDSLGNPKNYFEEVFYDDSLFAISAQAMDKAIKLKQNDLVLRFSKITSLLAYEKESPDMALSTLKGLVDYNYTSNPVWTYGGEIVDNEFFIEAVLEYCYSFYMIDSPVSLECFREISEKMLKYNPGRNEFLSNMGTYYLSAKNDTKSALKYYNKVLKNNPSDYAAIKNCIIIARKNQDFKLEKKYLPMLINVTTDEAEKQSSKIRLNSINDKK